MALSSRPSNGAEGPPQGGVKAAEWSDISFSYIIVDMVSTPVRIKGASPRGHYHIQRFKLISIAFRSRVAAGLSNILHQPRSHTHTSTTLNMSTLVDTAHCTIFGTHRKLTIIAGNDDHYSKLFPTS